MTMAETRQFLSFFVGEFFFGVDLDRVREVVSGAELTPVPLSPPEVRGLINLRGQILSAIDLGRCLQLAARPVRQTQVNIIAYADGGCVSLLVDKICDVVSVDADAFEYRPATLQGRPRELIRGAFKLDGQLLLALDTEKVLDALCSG